MILLVTCWVPECVCESKKMVTTSGKSPSWCQPCWERAERGPREN